MIYTFAIGECLILPISGLVTYIFRWIFKDRVEVYFSIFVTTFAALTTIWLFLLQSSLFGL